MSWEEEGEAVEQGKGNWLRDSTLPFKGSTTVKPQPPRTGRKPKKRRSPNCGRMYGGASSSNPHKTPRPVPMWFGSASRRPCDPPEHAPPRETDNPAETGRPAETASEANLTVPPPELPTRQSLRAAAVGQARVEARDEHVAKKKLKRRKRQLTVSIDGKEHILRCDATVGSAYLATSAAAQRPPQTFLLYIRGQVLSDMHAALPSRPLVHCQLRPLDATEHGVGGDTCGAAYDADCGTDATTCRDDIRGVEGSNGIGDVSATVKKACSVAAHGADEDVDLTHGSDGSDSVDGSGYVDDAPGAAKTLQMTARKVTLVLLTGWTATLSLLRVAMADTVLMTAARLMTPLQL